MIEVTKEQIIEVLERFRDMAHWMMNDPRARQSLEDQKIEVDGVSYKVSMMDDGKYSVSDDLGISVVVATFCYQDSPGAGMDNVRFTAKILESEKLDKGVLERFEKVMISVCSAFQRSVAFSFFSRMQDVSIEMFANTLMSCTEKK